MYCTNPINLNIFQRGQNTTRLMIIGGFITYVPDTAEDIDPGCF